MITSEETQEIAARVVNARKANKLKQREVHDRLVQFYALSFSGYRAIEARARVENLTNESYKIKINKPLVRALATALEIDVTELVTRPVYERLPDTPRYLSTAVLTDVPTDVYVTDARNTAARLSAYMHMYRLNARSFGQALTNHGYKISESHLRAILNGSKSHLLTHDIVATAADVFTPFEVNQGNEPFNKYRILGCLSACPHCEEWRITD